MKSSTLAAVIVATVLALGGGAFVISKDKESITTTKTANQTAADHDDGKEHDENGDHIEDSETTSDQAGPPTMAQVKLHNNKDDCWTIVSGVVYDITSYIPRHPGGDEILAACGTDGTNLFTQRETSTGEQVGSGTPHSSRAASQLESLKIGVLAE